MEDQKYIDLLLSRLPESNKETGVKIKVNGRFVKMSNGKHLWPSLGAAKAALRNEFAYDIREKERRFWESGKYQEARDGVEDFFKTLFDSVEFVELS